MASLLDDLVSSKIVSRSLVLPDLLEFTVHSPLPAKNHKAGQFFKLRLGLSNKMADRHIILYPTKIDKERSLISFTLSLHGGSALHFASHLPGAISVDLVGPIGKAYDISSDAANYLIIAAAPAHAAGFICLANALPANANIDFVMCFAGRAKEYFSKLVGGHCKIYDDIENAASRGVEYSTIFLSGSDEFQNHCRAIFKYRRAIRSLNSNINCAMGGVCGSCITYVDAKTPVFGCIGAHHSSEMSRPD